MRQGSSEIRHAFLAENDGVVAVEFSLIAFPFIMLIVGISALGLMMFSTLSMDYAAQKAARQVMTGQIQASGMSAANFRTNVVCPLLPSAIFNCNNVVVSLKSFTITPGVYNSTNYYQFVNAAQSGLIQQPLDNAKTYFCAGIANSYEVLQILYPYPIYLNLLASSAQVATQNFIVQSSVTFKNEPFSGGSTASGC